MTEDSATVVVSYRRFPKPARLPWIRARRFTLCGPAGEHILRFVSKTGQFYEADLLETLDEWIDVRHHYVIDVGANIGNHTLFFAAVMGARVIAIEPNPEALRYLKQNSLDNRAAE